MNDDFKVEGNSYYQQHRQTIKDTAVDLFKTLLSATSGEPNPMDKDINPRELTLVSLHVVDEFLGALITTLEKKNAIQYRDGVTAKDIPRVIDSALKSIFDQTCVAVADEEDAETA